MARTVRVYEVLADTGDDGSYGDGVAVVRFEREADARAFADRSTVHGRGPASVEAVNATPSMVNRWIIR